MDHKLDTTLIKIITFLIILLINLVNNIYAYCFDQKIELNISVFFFFMIFFFFFFNPKLLKLVKYIFKFSFFKNFHQIRFCSLIMSFKSLNLICDQNHLLYLSFIKFIF